MEEHMKLPFSKHKIKAGARTVKTALSVAITMYLCILFKLQPPLGMVGVIVALDSSIYKSLVNMKRRIYGTVITAIISVAFGILFLKLNIIIHSPLQLGIFIGLFSWLSIIYISSHNLGLMNMIILLTIGAVLGNANDYNETNDFIFAAITRVLSILIGITVAFLINISLYRPRFEKQMIEQAISISKEIKEIFQMHDSTETLRPYFKKLETIRKKNAANLARFNDFQDEIYFSKNVQVSKLRKGVAVRQAIEVNIKAVALLKKLQEASIYKRTKKIAFQTLLMRVDMLLKFQYSLIQQLEHLDRGTQQNHHESIESIKYNIRTSYQEVYLLLDNRGKEMFIQILGDLFDYCTELEKLEIFVIELETRHEKTVAIEL